jgi:acetolactate synthase-1/2/3 large subunit
MARPITKYAATIFEPFMVRYELEKAWHLATSGRPGPVFLDVPLDLQASDVDPESLPCFIPQPIKSRPLVLRCSELAKRLHMAERPLLLGGEGIREAGAVSEFLKLAELLTIPTVTAWMPDIYPPDQPYYAGRIGTLGTRAGNIALQNADFILAVGSRLSVPQTTFNWENFAKHAHVVSINIDPAELTKPIHVVDELLPVDPLLFLQEMLTIWNPAQKAPQSWAQWLDWCKVRVARYPEITDTMRVVSEKGIHPYFFIEELFKRLEDDAFVACGNAASACVAFQAAPLRFGQRLTSNASAGAMGHDLPSAIGAAVARKGKRVICLAGDGSIMMNLQELQSVAFQRLPVGVFVMNNGGYLSIRTTQKNFFGRYLGESPESGISFPDFASVAKSFGLPAFTLEGAHFAARLAEIVATDGPWLCDVRLNPEISFEPCIVSTKHPDGSIVSSQLDNMFPFLQENEKI